MKFVGRVSYSVDAKGRLSVPAEWRSLTAQTYGTEELWVTTYKQVEKEKGRSVPLLHAYPKAEWDDVLEKLAAKSGYDKRLNNFRRHFVSGATQCVPDKQGRIALSTEQRKHAQIENEVMFVGSGTRYLEIWDLATWEQWRTEDEDTSFEGIEEVLQEAGL